MHSVSIFFINKRRGLGYETDLTQSHISEAINLTNETVRSFVPNHTTLKNNKHIN